jgi:hypothetical protein
MQTESLNETRPFNVTIQGKLLPFVKEDTFYLRFWGDMGQNESRMTTFYVDPL